MPASESTEARPSEPTVQSPDPSSVSMSDLLASCAAASAVSTPPTESQAGVRGDADAEDAA
ncbi:hypothetical protein [Streptomyces sp. IB2014 016-6]|uniref:hypothetical protein n=1 Tax=Streptomyces sp. IB2014 016-6 TaxID=2517818 RepID=UPI0011CBDE18|nr:hypothetical protein [Streptomyces sp. IB2014 016-6]TXL90294.1 hypothetical protein EW053_10645 [Streptomyces sp. IB2014 016-6]